MSRKNRKNSELEKTLKKVRRNFNKFIQLRDLSRTVSGEIIAICLACNSQRFINCSYDLKFFHASHYWNDNDYQSVRFDVDNVHGCCAKCNTPSKIGGMSGNLSEFQIGIIDKIGIIGFEQLETRRNQTKKWTITELEIINKDCLAKIKELKKYLGGVVS